MLFLFGVSLLFVLSVNSKSILIASWFADSGALSDYQEACTAGGFTCTSVTQTQWAALTASDFSGYDAIWFGDDGCRSTEVDYAPALTNIGVWSPLITGNILVVNYDETFHHESRAQIKGIMIDSMEYVTEYGTGLYFSAGCRYISSSTENTIELLAPWGTFKSKSYGSDGPFTVDTSFSSFWDESTFGGSLFDNWHVTTHGEFTTYPSDFTVVGKEISTGFPIILAKNGKNDFNPINRMDQRVRALESHFYPVPNAISELEKYYSDYSESILTLDESLRKLINGLSPSTKDVTAAVDALLVAVTDVRNGYNLLEMDKEIYKLQQRVSILETKVTDLIDNDYDSTLWLLIKQLQCELSQKPGDKNWVDCRVRKCQSSQDNANIDKMIKDLSDGAVGQCPDKFDEVYINSAAHQLITKESLPQFDYNDNNNNNKPQYNNYYEYQYLETQMYFLYAIIGFLVGLNIIGFCCIYYTSKVTNANKYNFVSNKDMEIIED